jgi:hypothetical protein
VLAAAAVIVVAIPVLISLRPDPDVPGDPGGLRGGDPKSGSALLLAPRGDTLYPKPVFVWLPPPAHPGAAKISLTDKGSAAPFWEKEGATSPMPLATEAGAPVLQPGRSYRWEITPAGGGAAASGEFTLLAFRGAGAPAVPPSIEEALASAEAASRAGRPSDGIMILAILPPEWRSDERIRGLRLRLMEASGITVKDN